MKMLFRIKYINGTKLYRYIVSRSQKKAVKYAVDNDARVNAFCDVYSWGDIDGCEELGVFEEGRRQTLKEVYNYEVCR